MSNTDRKNVDLGFFTRLGLKQQQIARQLLEIIYNYGREFAPELFDNGKRLVPIGLTNFDILFKKWMQFSSIMMRREAQFGSEIVISTGFVASGGFNTLSFWVEEGYFESQSRAENFLQMSIAIYDLLCPVYGSIHQTRDAIEMATVQDPRYGPTVVPVDLRKGLPDVFWANFFGPEYVELIGKHKLLATPCHELRQLSDGGMLILTTPSPLAPSLEINRVKQKVVRDYLGEDLFYHWGE
jgi:hypothetical protein